MKHIISLLGAGLVFLNVSAALAQEPVVKDGVPRYVETRLVPEFSAIKPGQTMTFAIVQTIVDSWHTYWKNPGDSGEALRAEWDLPDGFTAGDLQWPIPHRIPVGPLLNFGYSNQTITLADITAPATLSGSEVTLKVALEWLVCQEICVPETTTISLSLPVASENQDVTPMDADLFNAARANIPARADWPGMLEEQSGKLVLTFTPDSEDLTPWQNASSIEFFPDEWGVILNAEPQSNMVVDNQIKLSLARDTRDLHKLGEIQGVLAYESADGSRFGKVVQVAVPAAPAVVEEMAKEELQDNSTHTDAVVSLSLWQALGLAVLGGLILNLMPCVFPVLSMKALSLVKMSAREQSHAVTHGLLYTLGVLVCFVLIAAALIALQQAGSQIGWGFQLQNPVVVLLLAYLLFLIGLNLSGVFEIGSAKLTSLGSGLAQKQGYAGSFFTGMLATIVATPCTAPFMGAAMGYALTQSPVIAILIFATLGIGLALPYLLLTAIPPLRRALPRPGAWMETFRQFLAFPMYASVAWLVWVYGQQIDGAYGVLLAGFGIVFIAMGVWMWKNAPQKHPANAVVKLGAIMCYGVALAIAAVSMVRTPSASTTGSTAPVIQHAGNWQPFTQVALDDALKGNDPVFVNMTASWCITCKVNERVALATDDTQKLFADQKVLYLIGDWTNQNPEITAYLNQHGRSGVPIYVYYGSRDLTTSQRPDPVVLPQLLTPGLIADVVTYN